MFSKKCKQHLKDTDMGRIEHMFFALSVAVELSMAVVALIIHSVIPRFFTTYASDKVLELAERFEEMKNER